MWAVMACGAVMAPQAAIKLSDDTPVLSSHSSFLGSHGGSGDKLTHLTSPRLTSPHYALSLTEEGTRQQALNVVETPGSLVL